MTRLLTPSLRSVFMLTVLIAMVLGFTATVIPVQKVGATDPLLLPPKTYNAGGPRAVSLLVGDLNQDGYQDVVVANYCDANCSRVSLMRTRPDVFFQYRNWSYGTGGAYARSIAFADVNNDGRVDLVVANEQSPQDDVQGVIGVLKGHRRGRFQKAVAHDSGGLGAKSVAVDDVNHDGNHDILVANTNNTAVLLGRGDGRFRAPVTYDTGGNSIAVADLNHDGKPDLVVAGDLLFLRLGNPDGTFQEKQTLGAGGSFVAIGDLNRDGHPDLIMTSYTDSTVSVLLGNGDGTFHPPVVYATGAQSATSAVLSDINRDGNPDVLVTSVCAASPCPDGGPGQLSLLLGNSDGSLQPALTFATGGNEALSVVSHDMDGDGKNDAIVANGSGNVAVLLNNIPPRMSTVTTLAQDKSLSDLGETVTFTSSTVRSDGGRYVDGSVTFLMGGYHKMAVVPVSSGQASLDWQFRFGGHHRITAIYSGDFNNLGSVSPTIVHNAKPFPVPTRVHLTSSANPAHVNQPVTFNVTVTNHWGTIPDGELVTFQDVSTRTPLGTAPLVGAKASITVSFSVARTHIVRAEYAGDSTYQTNSMHVHQVVE